MAIVTLTLTANSPWVRPANVSILTLVELIGAGGSGADGGTDGGGGGGGGLFAFIADVTPADTSISYVIAEGGSEVNTSIDFGAASVAFANSGANASGTTGGQGGQNTSGGATGRVGGNGGAGESTGAGGGGGGSGGSSDIGGNGGAGSSGTGGAAGTGGTGGGSAGGAGGNTSAVGTAGTVPGGGGGGGGAGEAGGAGARGEIRLTFYPDPAISACSPAFGSVDGGTTITLTGSGFTEATSVTFGTTVATDFSAVNDGTISCVTPAGSAGPATITVYNPVRNDSDTDLWTYYDPVSVDTVSPDYGSVDGGTSVTITGTGLAGVTGVTFGGSSATNLVIVNDTELTCDTPAHAAGVVDVVATNPISSDTVTDGFTYYAPPVIDSVTPSSGPIAGNTPVTIAGSGFTGATLVKFDNDDATNVAIASDISITCRTPAHAAGAVEVQVSNPSYNGFKDPGYTYVVPVPTDDDEELMEEYTAAVGDAISFDLSTANTIGSTVSIPAGANALTLQAIGGVVSFRLDGGDPASDAFQLPENKFITFIDNNGRVNLNKLTLVSDTGYAIGQFKLVMP